MKSYKDELFELFGDIPEYNEIYEKKESFYPPIIGVYFLFRNDKVVYVGQSKNIFARLVSHQKEKNFDKYFFYECSIEKAKALEVYFIIYFNPELNSSMPANDRFKSLAIISRVVSPEYFKKVKRLIKRKKITPVFLDNYDTVEIQYLINNEAINEQTIL